MRAGVSGRSRGVQMSYRQITGCLAAVLSAALVAACGSSPDDRETPGAKLHLVGEAQKFRDFVNSGNYPAARAMMASDARRWFEQRQGTGQPWQIEPGQTGPWAGWDDYFKSQKVEVGWRSEDRTAILTVRETNDYFQLLDRGWTTNEIVYHFDLAGKVEGMVIRAVGDRPPGRTEDFKRWAREHEPDELDYLMPGGEVNPEGDRPIRFRGLLNRWRLATGLPPLP